MENGLDLLDEDLLLIGRQLMTDFGKRIDLLGVGSEGELVVVELKRGRSPRDAVAQLLDYGAWARDLSYERIVHLFDEYAGSERGSFEEAFDRKFGGPAPEALNEAHRLLLVAAELDAGTERILQYLADSFGVPINAVFFQYFQDGEREYLTRTWFQDPREVEAQPSTASKKETWNRRDFYVSIGEGNSRSWDDMRQYGFVSGGGGRWYSRTLEMLFPGARVFACIPGKGYVGVGEVVEGSKPITQVSVEVNGEQKPLLEVDLNAPMMDHDLDDADRIEHVARVDWTKTLPSDAAVWETGMFANQNTVCRLRNRFTLDRLQRHFGLEE